MDRVLTTVSLLAAIAALPSPASADVNRELDSMTKELVDVAPLPGRDRVAPQPPPWCAVAKAPAGWDPSSLPRTIGSAATDWRNWIVAARNTCLWPNHPGVHKAVAIIAQSWVNMTGLPAAAAFESLTLRLDADRFAADQQKLCATFEISDEVQGEGQIYAGARRALFGCSDPPMWIDPTQSIPDDTIDFIDAAPAVDPVVELAFVLASTKRAFEPRSAAFDRDLLTFATIEPDIQLIAKAKLPDLADRAPYHNNTYARAVILESLYRTKLAIADFEREIAARSKDADWKRLLDAPARAAAAWQADAATHRDALARSYQFEQAFWSPSRKAIKGCLPALRADVAKLLKSLPHGSVTEVAQSLSQPVPSLLFSRLVACAAADGNAAYAGALGAIARTVRPSRGARTAGYHAVVEVLGDVVADRPRFPIQPAQLRGAPGGAFLEAARESAPDGGQGFVGNGGTGTVKSIKRTGDGVQVTFVTTKHQAPNIVCVDTKRIWRIDDSGTLHYFQSCRQVGMKTVDTTPDPITVPSEWAAGIAPGAIVEFRAMIGKPPGRIALPITVYANKSAKQLVNCYGIPL